MFKKILNRRSTLISSAAITAAFSLLSRILGVIRDRILASHFGAGDILDAYYAAFRIPDFIFNLLILGALSVAFIPVFTEYLSKGKEKEAFKMVNSLVNITLVFLLVVCGLLFIFIPYLMFLIAPGFNEAKNEITANLTRIMLLSPIFFGLSNIFSGILNSFKRFFVYSLAPVMYNLGIIFGAMFLVSFFGIYGVALGVIFGAFLHMLVQLPSIIKLGFRYRWIFDVRHEGIRRIAKLTLPRSLGLVVNQVNLFIITVIASTLAIGSVAIFNFANNLQYVPVGVFGISFAVACFPRLAESASTNNVLKFTFYFSWTFNRILFLIVPATVITFLLRAQIVRLVLGTGNFDWEDTVLTLQCLGLFALSFFAQALIPLLARSFYSLQDMKTPVIISSVCVLANVVLALILTKYLGVMGLALSFSCTSILNWILLFLILRLKIGDLNDKEILLSTIKIVFASLIMGFTIQIVKVLIAPLVDMQTGFGILIQMAGSLLFGIAVYLGLSFLLKCKEIEAVKEAFGKES